MARAGIIAWRWSRQSLARSGLNTKCGNSCERVDAQGVDAIADDGWH